MQHKFCLGFALGDNFTTIEIEGELTIEADAAGTAPGADIPAWSVESLAVWGYRLEPTGDCTRQLVDVDPDEWLHDRLLIEVLNADRHAIDDAWAAWMRASIDRSRRGFQPALRVLPTIVPANAQ